MQTEYHIYASLSIICVILVASKCPSSLWTQCHYNKSHLIIIIIKIIIIIICTEGKNDNNNNINLYFFNLWGRILLPLLLLSYQSCKVFWNLEDCVTSRHVSVLDVKRNPCALCVYVFSFITVCSREHRREVGNWTWKRFQLVWLGSTALLLQCQDYRQTL